jgi:hypothetical protein
LLKPHPAIDEILSAQTAAGAFTAQVHLEHRTVQDANACVTGLVLRALRPLFEHADRASPLLQARDRALAFLASCESRSQPGAFRFWPPDTQPSWIEDLPDDADDTAICALELVRYQRRPADFLRTVACRVLVKRRLRKLDSPSPEWLRRGVFVTWLRDEPRPNVVDCCVNANVAALLASADLRHLPGYADACAMIDHAVRWAGDSHLRARCISPFYPHPAELFYAVEHAVSCGVSELQPALSLLRTRAWLGENGCPDDRPVCSGAYGQVFWTSAALHAARRLAETFGVQTQS